MNTTLLIIATGFIISTMIPVSGPFINDEHNQDLTEVSIIDFSNTSTASWQIVNDSVMGGISRSTLELQDDEYALFSGTVSLENNGGFASVRTQATAPAGLKQFPKFLIFIVMTLG